MELTMSVSFGDMVKVSGEDYNRAKHIKGDFASAKIFRQQADPRERFCKVTQHASFPTG